MSHANAPAAAPNPEAVGASSPLLCILPPHILAAIEENGDDDDRAAARQALVESAAYRFGLRDNATRM